MYDATLPAEDVLRAYHSGCDGIANPETVERNREDWGSNLVDTGKHKSFPRPACGSVHQPVYGNIDRTGCRIFRDRRRLAIDRRTGLHDNRRHPDDGSFVLRLAFRAGNAQQ